MKIPEFLLLLSISTLLAGCLTLQPVETKISGNNLSENTESTEPDKEETPAVQKESQKPNKFILHTGIVQKITKFKGTLSEYSYYILSKDLEEIILFNSKQKSSGFDIYLDKKADIKGIFITGTISWKRIPAEGLQVLEITIKKQ